MTAVVLAAGGSSRLGVPKQLVRRRGRALVAGAVDAALAATGRRVIVVVGAESLRIRSLLARTYDPSAVEVVRNPAWRTGLASSLRRGLRALPDDAGGALIVLSDQPLVDARSLARLVAAWQRRPRHAAAACYAGGAGVPALVPKHELRKLSALAGDAGARRVLAADPGVTLVDMPEAAFDVDTREDLAALASGPKGGSAALPGAGIRLRRSSLPIASARPLPGAPAPASRN